ncbi:hypothetical protein L6164_003125 [Bauhinia variegata]|uniref:Uncharacterized protein n=1 Tax=Bauhinia variegata TaxID=167791 RepID=A0ACB9PZH7_BAUVA|nr:hypothetical protein L6164_003125 [Bauhinia variegata]
MLVLILKPIIFAIATLWSLLTRLIFYSIAFLLVKFIQAFKVPDAAIHVGFKQIAEIIRVCFESILQMMIQAMGYLVSKVFDVIKASVAGSVGVTGSVAGGLAEKTKASLEEALKDVPELLKEISELVSKMASDFLNNSREAAGYVAENA